MTSFLLQGSHWKDRTRVELTFTHGFDHVSEAAFAMCGNPTKIFSTDHSPQLTFGFLFLLKFEPANFEKRWLYTSVGQPQKRNFFSKKGILGWKSTTGKAAFLNEVAGLKPVKFFSEFWETFKNTSFVEYFWTTAFADMVKSHFCCLFGRERQKRYH